MARVSLEDVVPFEKLVNIGGDQQLAAIGVSVQDACTIIQRFPELQKFTGKSVKEIKPERLLEMAPRAIGAIIASGCGMPGNQKAEKKASMLPMQYQLDVIDAIIERTMPDGPGPFIARLQIAMAFANGLRTVGEPDELSEISASNSQPQSNG